MFDVLSNNEDNSENDESADVGSEEEYSRGVADMKLNENCKHSYALAILNKNTAAPEKKWAKLFETPSSLYPLKSGESLDSGKLKLDSSTSGCFDMERQSASYSQACPDSTNMEFDLYVAESWEEHAYVDNELNEIHENEEMFESVVVGKATEESLMDIEGTGRNGNALEPSLENCESILWGKRNTLFEGVLVDSDFESLLLKLMQEVEGLKVSELNQRQKTDFLEHELVYSKLEIDQLKKRCHKLESMASSASIGM